MCHTSLQEAVGLVQAPFVVEESAINTAVGLVQAPFVVEESAILQEVLAPQHHGASTSFMVYFLHESVRYSARNRKGRPHSAWPRGRLIAAKGRAQAICTWRRSR